MDISTDWTIVLQKEISVQQDLVQHLNIQLQAPLSPTTNRGSPTTAQEQELALAKSQLGFIDVFAEPLWNIGAELFFPGMQSGVEQIRENRRVWMSKANPELERGTPSFSTMTSETATAEGRSEGTAPTPWTTSGTDGMKTSAGEVTHVEEPQRRNMRKERSFPSLLFWKRKTIQKQRVQEQRSQE